MPLLYIYIYATAHRPTGQPTFRHAVLRLRGQPQMVIQLHHRPFEIRLDFYIAGCPCIIQRNHNGGEKILINLQKNIVDQQIVLTQLLHLSPLLLLLLRLVAINCPTSAFTLFYNPRPAFLQIIYSLSLPAAILSVLKSLHQSLHCT